MISFLLGSYLVSAQAPTSISISSSVEQNGVNRFGVNLGDQTYWDSGQMMKNLIFQNPGFEGLRFRTILKCAHNATADSCQDDNQYSRQQTGFWKGGTYEIISGTSAGLKGAVVQSTQSGQTCSGCGQTVQFDQSVNLAIGDYYAVNNYFPGRGDTGWWDNISGGGTITTEMNDLSPNTPGKQALLLSALGGKSVSVAQYFESFKGLSFIQLHGNFELTFRAKGVGGANQLSVNIQRLQASTAPFLNQKVALTDAWQDYTLTFSANEPSSAVGTVQVVLGAAGSNVELDDVSLQQTDSDLTNTTVFRDDVVKALQQLKPGTIRMMAGAALGSDIRNQLAPVYARYRSSFSSTKTSVSTIAYGIDEFVHLCSTVGAEPWITIPTSTTPDEMTDLILYLTGDGSDSYSASRIARGQSKPWTTVFDKIHIELGNETWNGDFKGETMAYPGYPQWANKVFGAARQMGGFQASKFDLVLDGWAAVPGYNQGLLHYSTQHDSISIAPYLMFGANDEPQSTMFGAMLAEPEMMESPGGKVYQDMQMAATAPTKTYMNVYETNLGTMLGKITQAQLDQLTPSIGAGLTHTLHMLMMMRLGVQYQNAFALQQYQFLRGDQKNVRMWGIVVDMGTTNRRRPQFLTQAMANAVISGNLMTTTHSGADPTWNQPKSSDGVMINGAHFVQSFAFLKGTAASIVVFNLNQTTALPVTFSGVNAPKGTVQMSQITSANITDSNEFAEKVQVASSDQGSFNAAKGLSLPPFSMTVLSWTADKAQAQAQVPSFSVAAGTYSVAQSVALSDATADATIYFTTDGTTPTPSSSKYVNPIQVSSSQTVQALATASGLADSGVASAAYVIRNTAAATPTFSPAAGTYTTSQSVVISDATAGSIMYYTTDGTTPTTSSKRYSAAIPLTTNTVIKAIAAAPNYASSAASTATYTITRQTATPTFSTLPGSYSTAQTVALANTTVGAVIHYTLDGTAPTSASAQYAGAIKVAVTTTIRASALAPNYTASSVATALYTITQPDSVFDMSNGFARNTLTRNGSAKLVNNKIQLTNGGTGQAGTAWYPTKVSVSHFTTDFDFQLPTSTADGFTFTIQNARKADHALGGNGGALGYQGVSKSVAVAFNLYQSGISNAQLMGTYTGGASPQGKSISLQGSGINLHSGNVFHAHILYAGTTLTITLTDTKTEVRTTKSFTVNIPSSVGSDTAYVGFTGSTGSRTSIQNILGWTFTR